VITNVATGTTRVVAGGGSYNLSPAWSPDGRFVAFASNRAARDRLELWIWEVKTGSLRKLSDANIVPRQLQWTPDSRKVITTSLGGVSGNIKNTDCLADATAHFQNLSDRSASSPRVAVYESEGTSQSTSRASSDPWSLDVFRRDLLMFDLNGGQTKVLDHANRIAAFRLSPDGSRVAIVRPKCFEMPGSQQILYDLIVAASNSGQRWTAAHNIHLGLLSLTFSWSPDGSRLAYQTDGPLENKYDCYVVDALDGKVRKITAFSQSNLHSHLRILPPAWDSNGRSIYVVRDDVIWKAFPEGIEALRVAEIPGRRIMRIVARDNGSLWSTDGDRSAVVVTDDESARQDGFYRVDLTTGGTTVLLEDGHHYFDAFVGDYLKVAPTGQVLLYPVQNAAQPIDLWITNNNFRNPRRVTHINPQYDEYELGTKRRISWLSLDGEMLTGLLLLPSAYVEGKRYPMIVNVYGGIAFGSDAFGFSNTSVINAQLFATRGYVVFVPDAPQRLGTPMLDLAKTILPGVNKAVEMGFADPKRLGLIGQSYGGYSVLSLLVQTRRFRAAVMSAGFGDLLSAYGQMDADGSAFQTSTTERGQGLMGATPWEARDRYIENSPVFYLNRIETPLLIVHGSKDTNVAPFLSDEVFVGMRRLGKETTYLKYSGEGHSANYWNYANRLDFCNRVIAWFDRHLK
jgi:dipeptidyl aminopeptidase/acylaminoacyl peptidase